VSLTPHRHIASVALAAALLLVGSAAAPRAAFCVSPKAQIKAAREKAEQATVRLEELSDDLEERNEEYLEVEAELTDTQALILQTERDLQAALVQLDLAESQLNRRATTIYRNGSLNLISVFVGVTDFQDLVTRVDLMRRIGRSDAVVVDSVKDAKARISEAKSALEARKTEQLVLRDRAAEKRREVSKAVKAQREYLAELKSDVKELVKKERERQERLARERAAEAARIAARYSSGSGRTFDPSGLGQSRSAAVSIARTFVGKTPYVWGGTTPAGFDCSGLVQYCYRKIGVSIPRTSRQQFRYGAFIPPNRLDLLEPGDLVFFGRGGDPSRVHHVGMYIGGGDMIHAPQTGMLVSVSSLHGRIASRGDYVCACRP